MAEELKFGDTTFTKPTDREVVATRIFDAPRSLVWDAFTNAKHLPNWMLGPEGWSMPVCEQDLRPGGAWHYVWRGKDGVEMEMRGAFREVVAPERLVNTESWGGDWPETLNTLILTDAGIRTATISRVLYPSKEARDRATQTDMMAGWARSYETLDAYLRRLV